jgi:hypothetical protein
MRAALEEAEEMEVLIKLLRAHARDKVVRSIVTSSEVRSSKEMECSKPR